MVQKPKRGAKDIETFLDLDDLITLVLEAKPHYEFEPKKELRDHALLAIEALTGSRVSEILAMQKEQIKIEKDWVIIRGVFTLKRWIRKYEPYLDDEGIQRKRCIERKREHVLVDKPLPRLGKLAPLTEIFIEYANTVKKGPLFDISRNRAWQIINKLTGKWNHYFRSQRISFLVNTIRSDVRVGKMMGIKSVQTLARYDRGSWEKFKDELQG